MLFSDVLVTLKINSLFYELAILHIEQTPRQEQARLQHLVVGHSQGYRGCCHQYCCCPGSEECHPARSPKGKENGQPGQDYRIDDSFHLRNFLIIILLHL